jgi:hypothetical protein
MSRRITAVLLIATFLTYPLVSQEAEAALERAHGLLSEDPGQASNEVLAELRSLEGQMTEDYPVTADEIRSLRLLAAGMAVHDGYNASVMERAPVIELQQNYTRPTWRQEASKGLAIAGGILGGTAFLAGTVLYAEALSAQDGNASAEEIRGNFNTSILPLTVGGGMAFLSTTVLLLARTPQLDPLEATIILDPRTAHKDGGQADELAELRDRRASLEQDLRSAIDSAPELRQGSWLALSTAITGAAVTASTLLLGQIAYSNYTEAQFTEDAVELRQRVNDLRTSSTVSASITAVAFSLWQWTRLQLERPRQILADLQQVDAAVQRERRDQPTRAAP